MERVNSLWYKRKLRESININRIVKDLTNLHNGEDCLFNAPAIEDKSRIKILPLETVLINSDFNINLKSKEIFYTVFS